jgi:hypothetical protein
VWPAALDENADPVWQRFPRKVDGHHRGKQIEYFA